MISRTRLANEAWESLLGAHAELMRRFSGAEIWREISMREYDVLYTLARARRPLSLAELNRHVLLSQPALSRMVERLTERGLLQRERSREDGRSVRLSLSERGAALQREVGRAHGMEVAAALGERLDRAELETLRRVCAQLAGAPAEVAA